MVEMLLWEKCDSATGTSQPNIDLTIQRSWFNQGRNFLFAANTCLSPGACGTYRQVRVGENKDVHSLGN